MASAKPTPRWAGVPEVAAYLNVATKTVYRMISAGTLPAYRAGKRLLRIDLNAVDDMLRPIDGDAA